MKTFVIGDIHGEYLKLEAVLKLANVDFEKDTVIQLGDIVDRGSEPFKCIDLLLKIDNLICIRGNHDEIFKNYILTGNNLFNGGHGSNITINKWLQLDREEQSLYEEFFCLKQKKYYLDKNNNLFIHAGLNPELLLEEQIENTCYWDRKLIYQAQSENKTNLEFKQIFNKIYIGHTPTQVFGQTKPLFLANDQIVAIDTGSGKGGLLTILDIDTNQFWQA